MTVVFRKEVFYLALQHRATVDVAIGFVRLATLLPSVFDVAAPYNASRHRQPSADGMSGAGSNFESWFDAVSAIRSQVGGAARNKGLVQQIREGLERR
jgi:hypothetical protein